MTAQQDGLHVRAEGGQVGQGDLGHGRQRGVVKADAAVGTEPLKAVLQSLETAHSPAQGFASDPQQPSRCDCGQHVGQIEIARQRNVCDGQQRFFAARFRAHHDHVRRHETAPVQAPPGRKGQGPSTGVGRRPTQPDRFGVIDQIIPGRLEAGDIQLGPHIVLEARVVIQMVGHDVQHHGNMRAVAQALQLVRGQLSDEDGPSGGVGKDVERRSADIANQPRVHSVAA